MKPPNWTGQKSDIIAEQGGSRRGGVTGHLVDAVEVVKEDGCLRGCGILCSTTLLLQSKQPMMSVKVRKVTGSRVKDQSGNQSGCGALR